MARKISKTKHLEKLNKEVTEFLSATDKSVFGEKRVIRTYNTKYGRDLSELFKSAIGIAQCAVKYHYDSSAKVKEFGLPSALSNAILRKYGKQQNIKDVSHIVIPVNDQSFTWKNDKIRVTPLKLIFPFEKKYHPEVINVKHLELSPDGFAHVQCQVLTKPMYIPESFWGIDRNSTSFVAVAANLESGKVMKLGRRIPHDHKRYEMLRKTAVIEGKSKRNHQFRKAHTIKHHERKVTNDALRKIAKLLVERALNDRAALVLEDLVGIRDKHQKPHKDKKTGKWVGSFKESNESREKLNSWAYYRLGVYICDDAHLLGVPVIFIPPEYTSQNCSRSDADHIHKGVRDGKEFKCLVCGHADHADVNAAFNIARVGQLYVDRVAYKREH